MTVDNDGSQAPAVGVLIALDGRLETAATSALDAVDGARVARRCADLAELLAAAEAGLGTVAVVASTFNRLDADAVDRLRLAGCRVVGVVDPDRDSTDRVRALGVHVSVTMSGLDPDAGAAAVVAAVLASDIPTVAAVATAGDLDWSAMLGNDVPDGAVQADVNPEVDPSPTRGRRGRRATAPPLRSPPGVTDPLPGPSTAALTDPPTDPPTHPLTDPLTDPPTDLRGTAAGDGVLRAPGRLITVWGAPGSPGRTVTAVTMAAELAEAGAEVLLVDADTHAASVASYLGILDESAGIVAAVRAGLDGRLTRSVLWSVAPLVRPRLRVLTGISRSARWSELRPAGIDALLDVAGSAVDVVVLDVAAPVERDEEATFDVAAPRRNAVTLRAIERADALVAVGAADPIGLQRLVRALQELDALGLGPVPSVVVNRVRASAVGERPQRRIGEALARFAGVTEVTFVVEDRLAVDRAVLEGRCLLEVAAASPVRDPLRRLAGDLAGRPARLAVPVRRRGA